MIKIHSISGFFSAILPERFFLVGGLLFGITMIFMIPPFQAPDEFNHFYRAWQVADGEMVAIKQNNRLGGNLPESFVTITNPFRNIPFHTDHKISSLTITETLSIPLDRNSRTFIDYYNTGRYAPTAYLPQAIFISIANAFNVTPLVQFYFGRLGSLIFWLTVVFLSIRIIPVFKWGFVSLALLPTSIAINTSISADVVVNALSFLIIALIVNFALINDRKQDYIKLLMIILSLVVFSTAKLAYFPLFLLFLIVPFNRFSTKKQWTISFLLISVITLLATSYWIKTSDKLFISYEQYDMLKRDTQQIYPGAYPYEQLKFIIHNPVTFSKTLIRSFIEYIPSSTASFIGKFGWADTYIPFWLSGLLLVNLFFTSMLNLTPAYSLNARQRIEFILIALVTYLVLAVVFYGMNEKVGSGRIDFLAGKYFIPIVPMFLISIMVRKQFSTNKTLALTSTCMFVLSYIVSVITIMDRFYVCR